VRPGVLECLRIAEVVRPREELPRAIQPTRREELLGPEDAERFAQFQTNQVLTALAAIERQVRRFRPIMPRKNGEQLRVLVVGVGPDDQDALVVAQEAKGLIQRDGASG
jgi:hypothetical protein